VRIETSLANCGEDANKSIGDDVAAVGGIHGREAPPEALAELVLDDPQVVGRQVVQAAEAEEQRVDRPLEI